MSRGTPDPADGFPFSHTRLSRSPAGFPKTLLLSSLHVFTQSMTPEDKSPGLGSFPFARRYSGNRCFFLFLRLLRCFSSPGSPDRTMDSSCRRWSLSSGVSPFRHPRIDGYLLLPAAFRSLSRLSSALSARASTLCSSSLDLFREPGSVPAHALFLSVLRIVSLLRIDC